MILNNYKLNNLYFFGFLNNERKKLWMRVLPYTSVSKNYTSVKRDLIASGIIVGFILVLTVTIEIILYLIWRRKYLLEEWDWFYRMCEAKDFSVKRV